MEGEAMSQGCGQHLEAGRDKETNSILELPADALILAQQDPLWTLTSRTVKCVLFYGDFFLQQPWDARAALGIRGKVVLRLRRSAVLQC